MADIVLFDEQPDETTLAEVDNPLYEAWRELFGDEPYISHLRMFRPIPTAQWSPGMFANRSTSREDNVRKYAWAVPSPEAIEFLATLSPIIEIGAGTGYWAHLLRKAGADVIAYDENPPSVDSDANHWHKNVSTFTDVLQGTAERAGEHPDRTLLLCWPPYAGCSEPDEDDTDPMPWDSEPDIALIAAQAFANGGG